MKITFVQPPSLRYDVDDLAPPCGLLLLAEAALNAGCQVTLLDLNLLGLELADTDAETLYVRALHQIRASTPDLVGFTSMALESHVCLELARRLKQTDPDLSVVVGGPHFSSIAKETLTRFPWIDYVVCGEGEASIACLISYLRGELSESELLNVWYRLGQDLRQSAQKPLQTLPYFDTALDLVAFDRYLARNPHGLFALETGRGCRFACRFCYSPNHWGRKAPLTASIEVLPIMLSRLEKLGAKRLFFVEDNFLNFPEETLRTCKAITQTGTPLKWGCYGTLRQIEERVIRALAEAGCDSIFIGVDAVTAASQKELGKGFFTGAKDLSKRIALCLHYGIVPTCALMVEAPQAGNTAGTEQALEQALLLRQAGCLVRLNSLTLYPGTPLWRKNATWNYSSLKPELVLDTHAINHENSFAQELPWLFPFHSTHMQVELQKEFLSGLHVAATLMGVCPEVFERIACKKSSSLWQVCTTIARLVGDLRQIPARDRRRAELEIFYRTVTFDQLILGSMYEKFN